MQLQAAIDEKDVLLKENINQMQTIDIFNQKLKDFEAKEMSSKNSIDYKQLLDNLRDAEAQIEVFKRKSEDFEVIRRNYTELQDALEKSKELNEILESNLKALESNSEDHSHIIERTFEMR